MAETASTGILGRLDRLSDWLSPMVVKEVRQIVRAREFLFSFGISLVLGLVIASLGGTSALQGNTTAGGTIFGWLMMCLTLLGIVVVPVGTFMALRNERLERTFDLIMLTTLPPRRIVVGKILAQGVKLLTLFAALAPFMAMSFLLGGIDLLTILLSLIMLFLWSLWACAACLFLSSAVKSRTMSGAMLVIMALGYVVLLIGGGGGGLIYMIRYSMYGGGYYPGGYPGGGGFWGSMFGGAGEAMWWGIAVTVSFCLVSMANLVLLAENCIALEDEDHTFALRVGLFVQFLMIAAWATLPPLFLPTGSAPSTSTAFYMMAGFCGVQLLIEAMFLTTGDMALSRRTQLRDKPTGGKWISWITVVFRPGGGRALAYILTQMVVLILLGYFTAPTARDFRWAVAFCGYIAFFTGLPAYFGRLIAPKRVTPMRLRLTMLLMFLFFLIAPEILHYFAAGYEPYGLRHLFNPFVTLGDWETVDTFFQMLAISLGGVGLLAYIRLMMMARQINRPAPLKAMAAHAR